MASVPDGPGVDRDRDREGEDGGYDAQESPGFRVKPDFLIQYELEGTLIDR
ncbi:hypothetical protein KIPB_015450, partial [Kipferlia bialata]|eukprot:g15450.t1